MISWSFTCLVCESCVYYKITDQGIVIAALHVNNFLLIISSKKENNKFKDQLCLAWTITDLGLPKYVVGIAIE